MSCSKNKQFSRRIILTYCWGNKNIGDKGITPGVIRLIKAASPDCNLAVVSLFDEHNHEYLESKKFINSYFPDVEFLPYPIPSRSNLLPFKWINLRIPKTLLCIFFLISPRLYNWMFGYNRSFHSLIASDLIIGNGGVLYFWEKKNKQSLEFLFRLMYPILVAKRLRIKHGFYGQTAGPFFGVGRILFKWFFSSANFIFLRESISKMHLIQLGISTINLKVCSDGAFILSSADYKNTNELLSKYSLTAGKFIVVTLRATTSGYIGKINEEQKEIYFTLMKQYLDILYVKTNLQIVIVTHTSSDIEISYAMRKVLNGYSQVISDLNSPDDLIKLYSASSFLIGMRLHSLIFGLASGVPAIAIFYKSITHKTIGIMNDLNLSNYAFDIDKTNLDDLVNTTMELYLNREILSRKILCNLNRINQQSLKDLTMYLSDI